MFGKKTKDWPEIEKLITEGQALRVEKAYAELHTSDEDKALKIVEALVRMREGHVTELPKHEELTKTLVAHARRLRGVMASEALDLPDVLNAEQRQAIKTALSQRFSIITGGPGTGKTFTAATLIRAHGGKVLLGAPTGKAASHLLKKAGGKGGTLHSLLGIKSPLDYWKSPRKLQADLVVIDESSMIDFPMFSHLLSAISSSTRLVMMGDFNQLPAVEGGSIFADLVVSGKLPCTELKTCLRSDRHEILNLAQQILEGEKQDIRTCDLGFSSGQVETIYKRLFRYVKLRDFSCFRILSTLRRGPLGVNAINQRLHEHLKLERFPILLTQNDARRGFVNGDTAMVEGGVAYFPCGREERLCRLPSYELAYCLSVHKSQGSEYDEVLFLVPEGSEVFGKEVLYTAITRARNFLDIDGEPKEIRESLHRSSIKPSKIRHLM